MEEQGTFPEGIIVDGTVFKDFVLVEETFRHSLELANDPTLDRERIADPVYYDACLYARRLTITGISKVTPEMVENLSGADGNALIRAVTALEKKRKAFRDAAQAAPEG